MKIPQRCFEEIGSNMTKPQWRHLSRCAEHLSPRRSHVFLITPHSSREPVSRILTGVPARQDTRNISFPPQTGFATLAAFHGRRSFSEGGCSTSSLDQCKSVKISGEVLLCVTFATLAAFFRILAAVSEIQEYK